MSDYPTEDELTQITQWPATDLGGLWALIRECWHWPESISDTLSAHEDYVARPPEGAQILRLATGGWSGNEDIISAYRDNHIAWALTWRLSARGGLHIFAREHS